MTRTHVGISAPKPFFPAKFACAAENSRCAGEQSMKCHFEHHRNENVLLWLDGCALTDGRYPLILMGWGWIDRVSAPEAYNSHFRRSGGPITGSFDYIRFVLENDRLAGFQIGSGRLLSFNSYFP